MDGGREGGAKKKFGYLKKEKGVANGSGGGGRGAMAPFI